MQENRNLGRQKGANKLRLRPGVMLGSDDIRGVQQTFFEIVSNSIDRFKKGYGDKIIITRHKDNSFTIQDFADGLPMDWNEEEQAYNWELALRVLYAGDNYDQSESNYGVLGYNGLGLTSTQFTSEYMNVIVYKNGTKYEVNCKKGRPTSFETGEFICEDTDDLFSKENGARILKKSTVESHLTGTIINYKPDLEVFTDINIPENWIKTKIKKQVVVNQGLKIIFNDELNNESEEFEYDSLEQYIEELGQEKNLIDIVSFKGDGKGRDIKTKPEYQVSYEMSFSFNNEYPKCEYYHNSSELTELNKNATTKAIEKAFVDVVHNHLNINGLYNKKEGKIKFADIEDSLLLVISSKSTQTSYANQTKLAIDNKFIREFVTQDVSDKLHLFMTENKDIAKQIMDRVLVNFRSRVKSDASRKALKKELEGGIKNTIDRPEKFVPCTSKNPKEIEFIIIEGDSALNAVKTARDSYFQCILPLKGKPMNVIKNSLDKILKNEEVKAKYKVLGCGMSYKGKPIKGVPHFNIDNLNINKYIISTDYDVDGLQIQSLSLAEIYTLSPELITNGYVYILYTPLYAINLSKAIEINGTKTKRILAYSEDEKNAIVRDLKLKGVSFKETRYKGLGSLPVDIMATAMNPKTRIMKQVTIENAEEAVKYLNLFMADETLQDRKDYIEKYGSQYFDYSRFE